MSLWRHCNMHTIRLLPLVPLSFIAIAFTEHCKKALGTKHALLQCTSGTESAEKAKKKKTLTKTKPVSLRFAAKQLIMKNGGECLGMSILALFNRIIYLETVPFEWHKGIIIPIFKKSDRRDLNNYRGILLTSCVSKIFNCIIAGKWGKLKQTFWYWWRSKTKMCLITCVILYFYARIY